MTSVRDGATDLYRFYDADDRLLYVGISLSAVARASQHRAEKSWWPDVARMDVEHLPSREAAMAAELAAIRGENPAHNVAGVPQITTSPKWFRVGGNHIVVTPGRVQRSEWGALELAVRQCPICGGKHRHGVLDLEIHRGIAYRFPHCHEIKMRSEEPWQIIAFKRRDMKLDPSYSEDEDYTRNGSQRLWSHRQFRRWRQRNTGRSAA